MTGQQLDSRPGHLGRIATSPEWLGGVDGNVPLAGDGSAFNATNGFGEIGLGVYGLFRHAEATPNAALMQAFADRYVRQTGRGLPPRQVNSSAPQMGALRPLQGADGFSDTLPDDTEV